MPQSPLVSILLPTYNRARYLAEAIPSALAQAYPHIELLILDDASPDNTSEVARSFETDPRVRYIRHPQNLRLPGNWRAGLEIAQGEYVCFLEDDDLLHPDFVERLLEPLRADSQTLLSFCDHGVIRADGTKDVEATEKSTRNFGRATLPPGVVRETARAALLNQSVNLTAALFRRRLLPPTVIDPAAQGAMDFWLVYNSLRGGEGGNIFYIPERLMDYRVHGNAMSNQAPLYVHEGMAYVYSHIVAENKFPTIRQEARRKLHSYQTALGFSYLAAGRSPEAREAFATSRESGPSFPSLVGSALAHAGAPGMTLLQMARRFQQRT